MTDQQRVAVEVRGTMLGASSETESSEASSHGGDVEIEREFDEDGETPMLSTAVVKTSSDDTATDEVIFEYGQPGGALAGPETLKMRGITTDLYSQPSAPPVRGHDVGSAPSASKMDLPAGEKTVGGSSLDRQPKDGAFGIAFRPRETSKPQGYSLPSGPAFVDEDEFESEISAEFRVVAEASGETGLLENTSCTSKNSEEGEGGVGPGQEDDSSGDSRFREAPGEILEIPQQDPDSLEHGIVEAHVSKGEASINAGDSVTHGGRIAGVQLDNATALKLHAQAYQKGGFTRKKRRDSGILPRPAVAAVDGSSAEDRNANMDDANNLAVRVGGDVRKCPVMEEEEEEEDTEELEQVDDTFKLAGHETPREDEEEDGADQVEEENEDSRRARVAREWKAIEQLRTAENSVPMEKGVGGVLHPVSVDEGSRMVSAEDALRYFRSQDLSTHKAVIVPFQRTQSGLGLIRRDSKLRMTNGNQLRDEVFLIAQVHYTPDDVMHRRLIQTIYRRMTQEKRACLNIGPHWDTIGFQGSDPCTDLNRSMGVFSLLQVLYLLENQPSFAAVLYRTSMEDITGWPFLCVSIGFTKEAVGVLRRGGCYSECNRRGTVVEAVHELHQAQFHAFLMLCRKEPATHHAVHLATVRTCMETGSVALVKAYRAYLSDERARPAATVAEKASGERAENDLLDFSSEIGATEEEGGVSEARRLRYIMSDEASEGS